MNDKTQKEMIGLLKSICIYEKATCQEVTIMHEDINRNMKAQHEILKQWMLKDLDHHLKDNKVALSAIEMIKEKARASDNFKKIKKEVN